MSKKSNPTIIGGFVIGAITLLAVGVALFGGAELFAERSVYVSYFTEQTNGLRVGSNITMNGVRVGYVRDIDLLVDDTTFEPLTRVTMEILPDTLILTRDGVPIGEAMRRDVSHDTLVFDAGLRAQLEIESFVTGQLLIELEFRPEMPPIFHAAEAEYPEIPTIPSTVQEFLAKFREWLEDIEANIDLGEITDRLTGALAGLDKLVNSQHLHSSLEGIDQIINDDDTQALTSSLRATLADLGAAADDASRLFQSANEDISGLAREIQPTLSRLNSALSEAEQTLAAAKTQLRGDTEQIYQLESTLTQVEGAARSLRDFFDYLERNPEALLRGKRPGNGQ